MTRVIHTHKGSDLETDTMIRLDNLNVMITILRAGIEGDGESVPLATTVRNYLFHLGQEVDLLRQNLGKISFQEISEQITDDLARLAQEGQKMKTVGIEEGLRMTKGIAGLIMTNLNLDTEDARAGAEAIWELLRQIEEDPTWEILRRLEAK